MGLFGFGKTAQDICREGKEENTLYRMNMQSEHGELKWTSLL